MNMPTGLEERVEGRRSDSGKPAGFKHAQSTSHRCEALYEADRHGPPYPMDCAMFQEQLSLTYCIPTP